MSLSVHRSKKTRPASVLLTPPGLTHHLKPVPSRPVRVLAVHKMSEDSEDEEEEEKEMELVVENSLQQDKGHSMAGLSRRRCEARVAVKRTAKKLHNVLTEHRSRFESIQPEFVIPDLECSLEERTALENNLEEEYAALNRDVDAVVARLARVRRAERALNPKEFAKPAVLLYGVSAQTTTWQVDEVRMAPFPRIADAVLKVVLAGYSDPDPAVNKPKRKWTNRPKKNSAE